MGIMQTIKRDFARHRQKAAVLVVLLAVMLFMSARAVLQMRPQSAAASTDQAAAAESTIHIESGMEADERIRLSKDLWRRLQEKRGVTENAAFAFDSSYYQLDPARPVIAQIPLETLEPAPALPRDDAAAIRRSQQLKIREQLMELKVQSTTTGAGKPWAIVNGQLVTVGDVVKGFEIIAIRPREVEFGKEGVTNPVRMPDEPRGQ